MSGKGHGAVPGADEAVKHSGRTDVKVTRLSLPSLCKPYIKSGVVDSIVLWSTTDLGYLTVSAVNDLSQDTLKQGNKEMEAGLVGKITIEGDQILMGKPLIFNKSNIEYFNF